MSLTVIDKLKGKMNFTKIKIFVAKWALYFHFTSGLFRLWSSLYRLLWERKIRTPINRFSSLSDLVWYIRGLKWRADSWRELWDAVSHPEAVQWKADNVPGSFIGDCDEFGVYSAAVIRNELLDNPKWSNLKVKNTYIFAVLWHKNGGEEWKSNTKGLGGHNVCLIEYEDGFAYMDYGYPSTKRPTIQEVAEDVRLAYAQVYEPLGWYVSNPNTLKLVQGSRT